MKLEAAIALKLASSSSAKDILGLPPITIEYKKGSIRELKDDDGNVVYRKRMSADYGYFDGIQGTDGDEVDCFVGPKLDALEVYVVHMVDMGPQIAQRENEDKCFVGFGSTQDAKRAFLAHYPAYFFGGMKAMSVEQFKSVYLRKADMLEQRPRPSDVAAARLLSNVKRNSSAADNAQMVRSRSTTAK